MALPPGRKPLGSEWFIGSEWYNQYMHFPKVNRVEVIDSNGRTYAEYNAKDVKIDFQDGERTMKVFLKND